MKWNMLNQMKLDINNLEQKYDQDCDAITTEFKIGDQKYRIKHAWKDVKQFGEGSVQMANGLYRLTVQGVIGAVELQLRQIIGVRRARAFVRNNWLLGKRILVFAFTGKSPAQQQMIQDWPLIEDYDGKFQYDNAGDPILPVEFQITNSTGIDQFGMIEKMKEHQNGESDTAVKDYLITEPELYQESK